MSKEDLAGQPPRVTPISREELNAKVHHGPLILIDAQSPGWYERERLPGAIKADVDNVDALVERLEDTEAEIAVYCWSESCTGSVQVSEALAERGFRNVRRYVEGKKGWLEAGLPIESTKQDHEDS